ncbi:hypothetical protein SDC9_93967 [bioreactor metagenome]|uniref:Uncharacterized protein n=1 Tax=bioreactor metagenome TaxID=1076179 RepID=A0A645A228_9ZZZZ
MVGIVGSGVCWPVERYLGIDWFEFTAAMNLLTSNPIAEAINPPVRLPILPVGTEKTTFLLVALEAA